MALTDMQVKKAQPKETEYRVADGAGLFLEVTPSGRKRWRFRYRFEGKEKLLSFGVYPDVSLAEARNRRHEARALVAKGIDPASERKAAKEKKAELAANSFQVIAGSGTKTRLPEMPGRKTTPKRSPVGWRRTSSPGSVTSRSQR